MLLSLYKVQSSYFYTVIQWVIPVARVGAEQSLRRDYFLPGSRISDAGSVFPRQ